MINQYLRKLSRAPETIYEHAVGEFLAQRVARVDMKIQSGRPHGLPGQLIVSLTSYPPRFKQLHLTLKCLLSQSMRADLVILWVAHHEMPEITSDIRELQKYGLRIEACDDFKSYNKIVHTLRTHPDAFIITVDDDLYYRPTLVEELVLSFKDVKTIPCHRCHRVAVGDGATIKPYATWDKDVSEPQPNSRAFPTGVGGVLYPPHSLHDDVLDHETFTALSPSADDVWLYWMGRRNGSMFCTTGSGHALRPWPGSQKIGLHRINTLGESRNDDAIRAMLGRYGMPL